jgi:predicted protein tyrosine phosphatase
MKLAQTFTDYKPVVEDPLYHLTAAYATPYEGDIPRWLFVDNGGVLRSATCARVTQQQLNVNCRSCGTEPYSVIRISANLVSWASKIVFVDNTSFFSARVLYEHTHYWNGVILPKSVVWDLDDAYQYMHPELQETIRCKLLD